MTNDDMMMSLSQLAPAVSCKKCLSSNQQRQPIYLP